MCVYNAIHGGYHLLVFLQYSIFDGVDIESRVSDRYTVLSVRLKNDFSSNMNRDRQLLGMICEIFLANERGFM